MPKQEHLLLRFLNLLLTLVGLVLLLLDTVSLTGEIQIQWFRFTQLYLGTSGAEFISQPDVALFIFQSISEVARIVFLLILLLLGNRIVILAMSIKSTIQKSNELLTEQLLLRSRGQSVQQATKVEEARNP